MPWKFTQRCCVLCSLRGTAAGKRRGYSVPTRFGFQDVVVKGFVDEVVILCGAAPLALHSFLVILNT